MAKGNRGGKRAGASVTALNDDTHINGKNIFTDELTYDEYQAVYDREMNKINAEMAEEERQLDDAQRQVDKWLANGSSYDFLDSVTRPDGDVENLNLERDTKKHIVDNYIKEYNNSGWDDGEGAIYVMYKDGSMVSSSDHPDKFKLTNIDTVIVEGSWGTTFCGKVKVTHDTPERRWDVDNVGGGKVNVNGSTKFLPKYKGFTSVWHVDFA